MIIALDYDNVLAPCTGLACDIANEEGYQIQFENVSEYAFTNFHPEIAKKMLELVTSEKMFQRQHPWPGAVEMVNTLLDAGHTVLIASAIPAEKMGIRANQILRYFPRIAPQNIILGGRKDLLSVDILLDDSPANLLKSFAKYPILFNQPWNLKALPLRRVSTYDEFLSFVKALTTEQEEKICLPSQALQLTDPS